MSSTNEMQARAMDFGRTVLKQVSGLSKTREEAPVEIVAIPTLAPNTPSPANDITVVSPNVRLTGTIITPDELHVAGTITGNISATSITIRASGVVVGDVAGEAIIVHGRIEGRIFGKTVKLCKGATVVGDIVAGQLGVDTDAVFEGASKRSADALSQAPDFSTAA